MFAALLPAACRATRLHPRPDETPGTVRELTGTESDASPTNIAIGTPPAATPAATPRARPSAVAAMAATDDSGCTESAAMATAPGWSVVGFLPGAARTPITGG
jgi:hypothetical protein